MSNIFGWETFSTVDEMFLGGPDLHVMVHQIMNEDGDRRRELARSSNLSGAACDYVASLHLIFCTVLHVFRRSR